MWFEERRVCSCLIIHCHVLINCTEMSLLYLLIHCCSPYVAHAHKLVAQFYEDYTFRLIYCYKYIDNLVHDLETEIVDD